MRDAGQEDIQTITLSYAEFKDTPQDEAPLAEIVARHYGTHHATRCVDAREFAADLRRSSMRWINRPSTASIPGS